MIDFKITIGIFIAVLNILTLIVLAANIVKSYNKASDVKKSSNTRDLDFYFMVMFGSMVFFLANAVALYTGYVALILHPVTVLDWIVLWRLLDRFCMFIVSIIFCWIRMSYNPFTED